MTYEKAPRPATRSRMRELYDTIDGLGGATLDEVVKYLPACSVTDKKRNRADVKKGLYNGVYRGHFIVTPAGQYCIAPMDYYKTRNAYVKDLNNKSNARRRKAKKREAKAGPTGHTIVKATQLELPLEEPKRAITKAREVTRHEVTRSANDDIVVTVPHWLLPFVGGFLSGVGVLMIAYAVHLGG